MKKIFLLILILIVIQPITYAQNKYQQQWFHSTWFNDCVYDYNSLMCKNVSYNNYIDYNYYNKVNRFYCINGQLYREIGYKQRLVRLNNNSNNDLPVHCTRENAEYFTSIEEYKSYTHRTFYNPNHKQYNYNYTKQFIKRD